MPSIAIIGAGCSGLTAAHILQDADYTVTLFEANNYPGGRATTRSQEGFVYDHGAQYIKKGAPSSVEFITRRFRTPDLIDIAKPVWTFNKSGQIQEGDPQQNAEPKWNYSSGLAKLGQLMAQGLNIVYKTGIRSLQQMPNGWQLTTEAGTQTDSFDSVLVTLPTVQANDLIHRSQIEAHLRSAIDTALSPGQYNPLISVMLGYRPGPRPRPYYALVNTDKAHPISWLAWEHEKTPERVPDHAGLLLAQMAPQYSREHWQTPDNVIIHGVEQLVSKLLDEALSAPIFSDVQRWQYALPSKLVDGNALNTVTQPYGLAFCGDGFVGGRVHLAIENAIMVAQQFIKH
jgi:renalase